MAGNIYTRQNDKVALIFRKASHNCYKRERRMKYIVISLSTSLCIFSILNRYSANLFPQFPTISSPESKKVISDGLIMLSGMLLIFQMIVSCFTARLHLEGVNFEERFDNHVFGMTPNRTMMRPISDAIIENYASKIHKPNDFFRDYYFDDPSAALDKNSQFHNYVRIFEDNYRLMLNTKGFFQTIWVGFIVIIIALATTFNDTFVQTLINVLIPSMSIISLIVSSWYSFSEQMRKLQNCINVTKEIITGNTNLNSEALLRGLQDSLFNLRMRSFEIPDFLVRSYEKKMAHLNWETESKLFNGKGARRVTKPIAPNRAPAPIVNNESVKTIQRAARAAKVRKDRKLYNLDTPEGQPLDSAAIMQAAAVSDTPAKKAPPKKEQSVKKEPNVVKKETAAAKKVAKKQEKAVKTYELPLDKKK